jgi:translation initiation factor 4B
MVTAKDRVEAREITDWTRKGPLPDLPGRQSDRGAGGGGYQRAGGFDAAASDAGSDRGERRRAPPFASDGKERDFGNWERRGPLSPVPGAAPNSMAREGRQPSSQGAPREHRQSPAWGEGRAEGDSRGPRREFQPAERSERPERPQYDRQPTVPELDNQWRTKMRPDAPASASPTGTPDASTPSSPAPAPAAPAGRPRLNLQKRTVSEAQPPPEATPSSNKPNPFGAARPIDTATREKEIEEKKQLELRQKKEADDKAREEKKAKDAEKAAAAKEAAPAASSEKPKGDGAEEKSAAIPEDVQGKDEEGTAGGQDEDANGEIVDDKAVKPQEIVRQPQKSEGAWRRKGDTPATPATPAAAAAEETTTEELDADGWSTVSKTKNPKARRGAPGRAIAS